MSFKFSDTGRAVVQEQRVAEVARLALLRRNQLRSEGWADYVKGLVNGQPS